jgi:hypothetical protein
MNRKFFLPVVAALLASATSAHAQGAAPAQPAPAPFKRNWAPPAYRIKAQVLVDAMMAEHPELLGLTLHGAPPGMTDYTMFAASYHDRIGKVSGPDDVMASAIGRIMIETSYKPGDNKAVVLVPLKDAAGRVVATAVFGFHDNNWDSKSAPYYAGAAMSLAEGLSRHIASHDDLFARAE